MKEKRLKVPLSSIFDVTALISVYYAEYSSAPNLREHTLDCWQIYYQVRHKMDLRVNDTLYTLSEGDSVFVAPGAIRQVRNAHGRNDCLVCSFDCTSSYMEVFRNHCIVLTEEEKDLLTKIVYLGLQCTERIQGPVRHGFVPKDSTPPEMLSFFKSYLEMFLGLVYNRLQGNLKEINYIDSRLDTRYSILVSRMKEYLSEHLHENVNIDDLANEFFMSPTHLKRVFKQVTDRSIMAYFSELKIKEAKNLIRKNELSFREISELLSYSSPSHFSDVFRRHTGQTPSAYQKSHQIPKPHSFRNLE
ncbi:MAG: AraC family transcriptional regulator [Clostridia bacterium]|nr:AraC family transcriptional regulator [Clostridia bacterium]